MNRNRRRVMGIPITVLLTLLIALPAHATQEGLLSLYSVVLDSPGTPDVGPVRVEIQRSDSGIEKLVVSAFGRKETAPPELLQAIKKKAWINGIQLSSVIGGGTRGRKNVNIVLTEGGTWGAIVVAVIGFNDLGKFSIGTNLSQEEVEEAERQ